LAGYKEVAEKLKEKILSGFYDEFDGRLPIIDDLCVEYEVSRVTMQRTVGVLKKEGLVVTSPKKGISTTRLKRPRTYMIGALLKVGSGVSHLHSQLCAGMERRAATHRCSVAIRPEMDGTIEQAVEAAEQFVEQQNVDGVVIWNTARDQEMIEKVISVLEDGQFPYVLVPEGIPGKEQDYPYICVDESTTVRDVIQHLFDQGHQKIAFASNLEMTGGSFVEKRYSLYRALMESAGLLPFPVVDLTQSPESIIDQLKGVSAVFCVSDDAMAALACVAMATDINIPQDLAVVGIDNTQTAKLLNMSSIDQNFGKMGELAVERIVAEASGKKEANELVQVKGELIVRGSSSKKRK
jgi:LacI family transcriptional regulator